ncbi:chloride channel [Dipodascopsis tothii]|uniref:chloride channel n=1 Tax=Dipodascopsis tothii TaxID=44089 RepID=UPI0034CE119C
MTDDGRTGVAAVPAVTRYEDFSTIDWVQDAAREQLRQRVRRQQAAAGGPASRRLVPRLQFRLRALYETIQGWLVVSMIGVAIGVNAAMLNIVTEWLADIKLGYCESGFYLNENFCCWGAEDGCPEWHPWTSHASVNYLVFVLFSVAFAATGAFLVKSFAPYAAGSGISEIKCIVSGFVMKGYLGAWTLLIKSICLPLAIASGLSVGKEGPSVHYAVCFGNVIARMFAKYRRNAHKMREILTACAATGVAVAFGSPIGGVLFSLEEISSTLHIKTMWRSYFCALVGTATLAALNPFRTGQLVMFQVHYVHGWHFFEIVFYILLGVFGGVYGILVIKFNLLVQTIRKTYLKNYAIQEATVLALITAVVCYFNRFLRIDMTESMEILFLECDAGDDYHGLCEPSRRRELAVSLLWATMLRIVLVIISYGCKVPAGIFVPSMAVGASFGRMVGILVEGLYDRHRDAAFFSACAGANADHCITPGTYAFLGAAAALSGIMNITVTVVVVMFELTGALTYILPTMIVVGVTKIINDNFGHGGIADQMIFFSGYPFLDGKEEHVFGVTVAAAMQSDIDVFPAEGATLEQVERLLNDTKYGGFPIVESRESMRLLGYIGRAELRYAIERARKAKANLAPDTPCLFSAWEYGSSAPLAWAREVSVAPIDGAGTDDPDPKVPETEYIGMDDDTDIPLQALPLSSTSGTHLEFVKYIDFSPLRVTPETALEVVMELFDKMGPSIILVEVEGRVVGLLTRKDLLKYQFIKHK